MAAPPEIQRIELYALGRKFEYRNYQGGSGAQRWHLGLVSESGKNLFTGPVQLSLSIRQDKKVKKVKEGSQGSRPQVQEICEETSQEDLQGNGP